VAIVVVFCGYFIGREELIFAGFFVRQFDDSIFEVIELIITISRLFGLG